ncbi:MAG: hypothetical protein ACK5N0_02175 [Synechococcaceae cyanobacterium]
MYVYNDSSSQTVYSVSKTNPSFPGSCVGGQNFGQTQTVNAGQNVWAVASQSSSFIESKGDCHVTTSVYADPALTQLIATEENAIALSILSSPDGSNNSINWISHRDNPVDFCAPGWSCSVVRSDTNPRGFPSGYQHLHIHVNTTSGAAASSKAPLNNVKPKTPAVH